LKIRGGSDIGQAEGIVILGAHGFHDFFELVEGEDGCIRFSLISRGREFEILEIKASSIKCRYSEEVVFFFLPTATE
jgi:hypothetical protein